MTCPVCCVARRDFDLIEAEKPAAFRPLSRTPAQLFYFLDLPIRLFCAVFAALFAEGLLSSTSDSIVNLANGGHACDIRYHINYWRLLVIFCVSPCDSISSSGSVIGNRALCAGVFSVAGQHCRSSMGLLC